MLGLVGHFLLMPVVNLWLATSSQSWRHLPRPTDVPLVHSAGADSDRVLLVGSGIAVGYGVASHELGLGGHLARELSVLSGHGASVAIVASPQMSPQLARTALQSVDLGRFDALVLTLGGLEVMTLMPRTRWRHRVSGLLNWLDEVAPANLEVIFVATAIPLLGSLPQFYRRMAARRARMLNAEVQQLSLGRPHTSFVEFAPEPGNLATLVGRMTYRDWARTIAPALAETLDNDTTRPSRTQNLDEADRLLALANLDLDTVPREGIERLVSTARRLFDASGASVSIIEGSRQVVIAADGMSRLPIPREDSACNIAIRRGEILIVEDALTDERLVGTSLASGEHFRFYAGYPIEAFSGHRVGALCIIDTKSRAFSAQDAALLRDLALRVQTLLWVNLKH